MPSPRLRRLALAVSVAGIALALTTACARERVSGSASAGSVSTSSTSSTTSATTTSASTTSASAGEATLEAADGADLAACADGECEVRVTAPAELPVPSSTAVEGFLVESIGADEVAFAGRNTGNRSGSGCTGKCRMSSTNNTFKIVLGLGSTARQNGLAVTLVAIGDGHAVVRLRAT